MKRRRSEPHTFEERLADEKVRLEAAFENIEPGPQRDVLERKLVRLKPLFISIAGFRRQGCSRLS
jgi:hypothetical protein